MDLVAQITDKPDAILIPKWKDRKAITYRSFILAVLGSNSSLEAMSLLLIKRDTFYKYMKMLTPEKALGKLTAKQQLLRLTENKYCAKCNCIKPRSEFGLDKSNSDELSSSCSICLVNKSRAYYASNAEKSSLASMRWAKDNPEVKRAIDAKRRAAKLRACPSWADVAAIRDIYLNCPEGYHVDHVIPLQGDNVCGLHVETNLQYLTAEENLKKGNKFPY